jgi:Rieske Fe-S protein
LDPAKFINRKVFLRMATLAVVAGFVALWNLLTGKQKQLSEKPVVIRINASKLGNGIFFFDKFILLKSDGPLKVLSNRCTHAGCRINKEIEGQLVCPCHGSRYDAFTGKVLLGPAGQPLHRILFSTDLKTGEIIITV